MMTHRRFRPRLTDTPAWDQWAVRRHELDAIHPARRELPWRRYCRFESERDVIGLLVSRKQEPACKHAEFGSWVGAILRILKKSIGALLDYV